MMTQIASLEEKCHGFESLEAEMFDEEIVFSNESTTYFYWGKKFQSPLATFFMS